jgi:hypothetical protein
MPRASVLARATAAPGVMAMLVELPPRRPLHRRQRTSCSPTLTSAQCRALLRNVVPPPRDRARTSSAHAAASKRAGELCARHRKHACGRDRTGRGEVEVTAIGEEPSSSVVLSGSASEYDIHHAPLMTRGARLAGRQRRTAGASGRNVERRAGGVKLSGERRCSIR